MTCPYPAPLDQLLTLGEARLGIRDWPDYLALGIGPEHVPMLIAMATDRRLHTGVSLDVWAPLHAWRALGPLHAVDAIEPSTPTRSGGGRW